MRGAVWTLSPTDEQKQSISYICRAEIRAANAFTRRVGLETQ